MTGIDINDIAPPSGNAWKPEVGDKVVGIITYAGEQIRDSYDKKRREKSLRIDLDVSGGTGDTEPVSVYVTTNTDVDGGNGYAKRDAKAIAAAVRAAGCKRLEIGATLAMKRVDDVPTDMGAAKAFVAEYKPPAVAPPEPAAAGDGGAVTGLI